MRGCTHTQMHVVLGQVRELTVIAITSNPALEEEAICEDAELSQPS